MKKSIVLATALLAYGGLAGPTASPSAADGPTQWWTYSIPFGFEDALGVGSYETVRGRPQRLGVNVGASSGYQVRKLTWSRWGKKTATGRGKARFCNIYGCGDFERAKIELSRVERIDCADSVDESVHDYHRVYRTMRLWGFEGIRDGSSHTAAAGNTRCG